MRIKRESGLISVPVPDPVPEHEHEHEHEQRRASPRYYLIVKVHAEDVRDP